MTQKTPPQLTGFRAFVVEDDPMIALDVAMSLQDAGAEVFGPYSTCDAALTALAVIHKTAGISVGVLDVELGGETSEPVARAMHALGIPLVFHAHTDWRNGLLFGDIPGRVVPKPSSPQMLVEEVSYGCDLQLSKAG